MSEPASIDTVAIIGAGLIGAGWATIFRNAGLTVRIYDQSPQRLRTVGADIAFNLEEMKRFDLAHASAGQIADLQLCSSVAEAVVGADYVQESVLETIDAKRAVCAAIDAAMEPNAIVGSSSSGIPASVFTDHLVHRDRFFVVHPVNPPHLVPVVEIVPAPWSDQTLIPALHDFMTGIDRKPIVLTREIDGFILNRLQGALLNEAWALFADGYATAADIDRTVSDGLGLRWSFMGPFETIDLNSPGGIADYSQRLSGLYHGIACSRSDPQPWPDSAIKRAAVELGARFGTRSGDDRRCERDAKLMALLAHKRDKARSQLK